MAGWFLPMLALLAACIPAVAQQATVSAPLNADEVIWRVVQMNEHRANALESYSSIRSYHLECHCLSHKKADMVVRADYEAPNKKVFTIVSESGSGTVRSRVFKKLLEAEQESMREENQQRSAITPQNYTFQLTDYQKLGRNEFYVLEARPLTKNKFLFLANRDIGNCYLALQKFAEAESSFQKILQYAPVWPGTNDSAYPINFRQIATAQMGQQHWTEAEQSLLKSVDLFDPQIAAGEKSDAELHSHLSLNYRGSQSQSYALLAVVYFREGRIQDALTTVEKGLRRSH